MKKIIFLLTLAAGCGYPKYAKYTSPQGDYQCLVPYAWTVMTDADGARFASANFIGPFEPDFYLGVPSFGVRWHGAFQPHLLPDGLLELYADADDYIEQTLAGVYGPKRVMVSDVAPVEVAGRPAKHFVVLSPVAVPETRRWGVRVENKTGQTANLRQHAYVVVPVERGFYVLVYPATRDGFAKYEKEFNQFVNSFKPLKNGPAGAKIETAAR